jgi:very-short-patch-repair endonuclease
MRRKIIPYNKNLKVLAKNLRNASTLGEILLWKQLNGKQFYGFDFHRQKPLLNFIVDFYCYELNLVIEIDGNYHNHEITYIKDRERDALLAEYQLTVLRFTEQEVRHQITNVLLAIEQYIQQHTPNPSQEGNIITQ